jgi:predicted enzyme related to lactoylglutathione lyase
MASDFIAHVEIPVKNIDNSASFFNKLFGWEFRPFGRGYHLFNTHKGFTVGLRQSDTINTGDTTIFHVRVNNIESFIEKAKEIGGEVVRGKTIIPAMGSYALIKDSDGNTIGLYQGS